MLNEPVTSSYMKNQIGLSTKKTKTLAEKLNKLLANYQVLYINTRGFHWNIAGDKFFELHIKFEELYNDFFLKIDEIAERILTLGYVPLHSFTAYIEIATVKETSNISDGRRAVLEIVSGLQVLIESERELLSLSGDADDEGTNSLMSDYIRQQEKLVWMYSAFLKQPGEGKKKR
jgi:starvation-inducible DNA-binding protein